MSQDLKEALSFRNSFELLKNEIGKIVVGQEDVVDQLLISLLSRGHCILVGVPGLAKTLLRHLLNHLAYHSIGFSLLLILCQVTSRERK
jgi:MoxR-like ATPase